MGILSRAARRLGRSRLASLSKVSRVPFHEPAPTLLARPALNRVPMGGPMGAIESRYDPRLVLGGGALGMFPMAALTAAGLREYEPWGREFAREHDATRDAEMRNQENRDILELLREGYW